MRASELKLKLRVIAYIMLALLGILMGRLAVVQFVYSDVYQTKAKDNRIRLVSLQAPRGEIYDRNGNILAANQLVYTLNLAYPYISQQNISLDYLVDLLRDTYPEITVDYIEEKIKTQQYRLFEPVILARNIPWELAVEIEENRQNLPGVNVSVEPLRYYPYGSIAGHVLGYIHSIDAQEVAQLGTERYNINSLIGKAGIEKQYEAELKGRDGARRVEVDARGRPVGELVTLEPTPGNNVHLTIDLDLQKVMDHSLQAILADLERNRNPKAKVGSAVVMDVKTGEILAMSSFPALNPDDWKGNLSSANFPYYVPQELTYNPLNPGALTNRALQATYPPGSTFKPIVGLAAMEAQVMASVLADRVTCQGSYWVAPYIRCTGVHGSVNYYNAMAVSCNTYFQEMARRAGKDQIIAVARELGLGAKSGIDLPHEAEGLLPTPEWKKEINAILIDRKYNRIRENLEETYRSKIAGVESEEELRRLEIQKRNELNRIEAQYRIDYNFDTNWQQFDTFNMSIGQGSNSYSVLQLANFTAALANGGQLMKPTVMQKISGPDGRTRQNNKPQKSSDVNLSTNSLAETKRAMLQVTQVGGTAYHLFYHFPPHIQVAAKTGTAETGRVGDNTLRDTHGVFIAFAPYDDPQIAFAGVVEYGQSGGGSAGQVAKTVFEHYFGIVNHLEGE